MADNNENSTRDLFAKEPLSTDSSGNLTPEAIAALLAQNSESSESESELANIDDVIMENYAISENVEEETTEVESVTELETEAEFDSEPLATDASGNLTPEAIAALMAQNNEFETEPIESESAEEAIEEEPVESEIPNIESTDDVKVETETQEPESEAEVET